MPAAQPDCIVDQVGHLIVLLHTRKSPSDAEWEQVVALLGGPHVKNPSGFSALILSDGGSPTLKQRGRVTPHIVRDRPMTALVSDASAVRFVVSTLTLLNENVRTFAPRTIDDALHWLRLPPALANETRQLLRRRAGEPGAERFETLQRGAAAMRGA
jgi:hypothetical protein